MGLPDPIARPDNRRRHPRRTTRRRSLSSPRHGWSGPVGRTLFKQARCPIIVVPKGLGLHTALDTSGFLGARADEDLLDATDLVLLDIKSWDRAFHTLGARKYPEFGIPFPLEHTRPPNPDRVADARARFAAAGLAVV